MNLLRLKLDALHCALLVAVIVLAVYGFGRFKEGASAEPTVPRYSRAGMWHNAYLMEHSDSAHRIFVEPLSRLEGKYPWALLPKPIIEFRKPQYKKPVTDPRNQ